MSVFPLRKKKIKATAQGSEYAFFKIQPEKTWKSKK